MAAPGVITQGLGWLFDPTSPLYIRSPWRAEMRRWLWHFSRATTAKRAEAGTAAMAELLRRSADLHAEIAATAAADAGGHPYGYAAAGGMYAFMSEECMGRYLEEARQVEHPGIPFQTLTGDQVRHREPALSRMITGGVLYPRDAHVDPLSFVRFLCERLRAAGAQIVEQTDVIRVR